MNNTQRQELINKIQERIDSEKASLGKAPGINDPGLKTDRYARKLRRKWAAGVERLSREMITRYENQIRDIRRLMEQDQ